MTLQWLIDKWNIRHEEKNKEGTDERSEAKARRVANGDEFSHTDGRAKVGVLSHLINNAQGQALTG